MSSIRYYICGIIFYNVGAGRVDSIGDIFDRVMNEVYENPI